MRRGNKARRAGAGGCQIDSTIQETATPLSTYADNLWGNVKRGIGFTFAQYSIYWVFLPEKRHNLPLLESVQTGQWRFVLIILMALLSEEAEKKTCVLKTRLIAPSWSGERASERASDTFVVPRAPRPPSSVSDPFLPRCLFFLPFLPPSFLLRQPTFPEGRTFECLLMIIKSRRTRECTFYIEKVKK